MAQRLALVLATLLVGACAQVIDEERIQMTLQEGYYAGEPYTLQRRTLQGRNGPFEQTTVFYRGSLAPCIYDSPNDCELAARSIIEAYKDRSLF